MLSSFINRRKVKKTRTPSEDQENPRYKLGNSYSKNHASVVIGLRPPALHRQSSPKVYLDFTPSGSNDWFPPEILAPPDEDSHLPIQPVPESSTSHSYDDVVVIGHAAHPFKPHPSPALPPLPVHDGPSPFEPRHDATTPPLSRKPAPAPIKIPSHPSKVQIQYTASANHSGLKESSALLPPTAHEPSNSFQPGTTHPSSAISPNDGSSAISGTTLARALIANSFILSNDGHSRNRYRSGCHLVRQDSATLPSANDKGLVVSPYWRDRRISGGEIVHSPDSGVESRIPPVPPIPTSLSSAASPFRHLSAEIPRKPPSRSQSLRIYRLSHQLSKNSELQPSLASAAAGPSDDTTSATTQTPASGGNSRPPLPQPPSNQSTLSHGNSSDHSLSNPSSPPHDSPPNLTSATSEQEPVSIRRSQPPPSLSLPPLSASTDGEDSSRLRPLPSENQDESQRTGASFNTTRTEKTMGSATSGEDIAKVLTAYRFGSPLKSSFPVHLHESPDPSTPSLSPWSSGTRSHNTDTSNSMSFPQTPTSAKKRSRDDLSILDMRRVFADSNISAQRQSVSSRSGRLPIGNDRPPSVHVPSSPYSRRSNDSRRSADDASPNPHSSGISSPDILDIMFIPSAPSLQSRPHPIKVIRKSLDSFDGISDRSPTTAEALHQTFPETPQAFSPLFSANIGNPGVAPLPSSSVGNPGTPLSAAQTREMLRRGISNTAITRAASLYTRKTPSTSSRTRMSPIPSAPGTPQSPEVRKMNDVRKSSRFEAQQSQAAANLVTASFSTPGNVSSPSLPSPRRNSDPTGRISRDLETFAGRVDLLEEAPPSTPEVKESVTERSDDPPLQRSTPESQEKSPSSSIHSLNFADDESRLSIPSPRDVDNASGGSPSKPFTQGSIHSDQARRSAPKQRPRALDLPVANPNGGLSTNSGATVERPDGSPDPHQGQGISIPDTTSRTDVFPVVSADSTLPVTTPVQIKFTASVSSSRTTEDSSPFLDYLPSTAFSSPQPSPNLSSQSAANVAATSSPAPSFQRSPARSTSDSNPTPTSSTSQVQNTSPALPSSTVVSPAQHDLSSSLEVPSSASSLRHSFAPAIHPPPPYQTAILSRAISMDRENEPPAGSSSLPPCYIRTPPSRQSGGLQPAQPTYPPQTQAQHSLTGIAPVSESVIRERSESVPDIRMPRNRPLGPRKPSGSQAQNKLSSLESYRLRAGSVSLVHPSLQRSGVGLGTPPSSRKPSTASNRGRSAPRFPTVPVRWRGYTLDVARWTFSSQQLQEITSRAIKASAESYYVRLLKLEALDTELPEELHRLELSRTDLKTRIRETVSFRKELLDTLTAHASGSGTLDRQEFERVVEDLGAITQLTDELNDELYTVADQIAQLKRLRDVHSSSALAMSLRKLNTSFLRQAAENQLLRERVASLETERDIAWTQAEHVAQEFDDLSTKLEQGVASTSSSTNNSRRASRVSAVRKSSIRVSKSGLRQSVVSKTNPRGTSRSSSIASFIQPSEPVPPVPPIPDMQDLGSGVGQQPRHRPPFIQTVNLPEPVTSAGLYSVTPNTETRAMLQAQRELCEMLGIALGDLSASNFRPRSMSGTFRSNRLTLPGLVRRNSDIKPLTPKRYSQHYREYVLSPYDRELTLANLTLLD